MLDDRGGILFEALIGLFVLSLAVGAVLGEAAAAVRNETDMGRREDRMATADRIMTALALLDRRDLDLRLGTRPMGDFVTEVQRPAPALYRLSVADTVAPDVELLVTVVFRPSGAHPGGAR